MVYSLRFAFKAEGLDYKRFTLPKHKHEKKLPVILSREEMRRLLWARPCSSIGCSSVCSTAVACGAWRCAASISRTWTLDCWFLHA